LLGIRADLEDAELISRTQQAMKLCSGKILMNVAVMDQTKLKGASLEEAIERWLPCVSLTHLPVPPPDAASDAKELFFEISKTGPRWDEIVRDGSVGAYIPVEIPSPSARILLLRDA
jgi:type VI secretion system protein ImpJ